MSMGLRLVGVEPQRALQRFDSFRQLFQPDQKQAELPRRYWIARIEPAEVAIGPGSAGLFPGHRLQPGQGQQRTGMAGPQAQQRFIGGNRGGRPSGVGQGFGMGEAQPYIAGRQRDGAGQAACRRCRAAEFHQHLAGQQAGLRLGRPVAQHGQQPVEGGPGCARVAQHKRGRHAVARSQWGIEGGIQRRKGKRIGIGGGRQKGRQRRRKRRRGRHGALCP